MFTLDCLRVFLSSCYFIMCIIDVYNILTTGDYLWIPVCMDVEWPEMGVAVEEVGFVRVYTLICSGIYIWVMGNLR